jgi:hypothetical protein
MQQQSTVTVGTIEQVAQVIECRGSGCTKHSTANEQGKPGFGWARTGFGGFYCPVCAEKARRGSLRPYLT